MNTTINLEGMSQEELNNLRVLIEQQMPKPDELTNLLFSLSNTEEEKRAMKKLGEELISLFDHDNLSRQGWLSNVVGDLKLFAAYMEPKAFPWKNASNVILPILSTAVIQYQARAFEALIPSREVVNVVDPGGNDTDKASRVKEHMNFQLLYEMEEFEEDADKMLFQQPLVGCVFKKTFFDSMKGRNVSSYTSAEDLVVSYTTKTSIEECRRKSQILRIPLDTIRRRLKAKDFLGDEKLGKEGNAFSIMLETPLQDTVNTIQGLTTPVSRDLDNERVFIEMHSYYDVDNDGVEEPVVFTIDYETREIVRITPRYFRDFSGKVKTIEYFTKYGFLPNPEGFYDLGFGTLMRGLNHASNTILNQIVDAGTLENLQGGFVAKRSGLKKGDLTFKMGEFKQVDVNTDDIRKAIYQLEFSGPSTALYSVLGLLYEHSKLVSGVSETMAGNMPSSDTPATTIMALIEEGKKVFTSIHKRNHRSFKKELRKLFRLNSIFLNDEVYFRVLDEQNIPKGESLITGRLDYQDDFGVFPVSDPNMMSKSEQVLLAKEVFSTTLASPITANNSQAIYEAQYRLYKALNVPNIDKVLFMQEPVDTSPVDENAGFLQMKPATALPQQNHLDHMAKHAEFKNSAFGAGLQAEGIQYLDRHQQEHMAMAYQQEEAMKAQAANSQALGALAEAGRLK